MKILVVNEKGIPQYTFTSSPGVEYPLQEGQRSTPIIEDIQDTQLFAEYYLSKDGVLSYRGVHPAPEYLWNSENEQWEPDATLAAQLATSKRAQLLQSSDWTQLPDVPLATKEAWAVYRQALRDITLQAGYPLAIDWPLAP